MSERFCIRGCVRRGEHYAACQFSGPDYEGAFPCTGCAPREAREGVMICAGCYGRSRRLLADLDDLLGRLGSLSDPMKATPTDKEPGGGGSTEPPAPIDADLIDAIRDITRTVVAWVGFAGRRTIDEAFDDIANDVEDMTRFAEGWLDRTPVDEDGIRSFWTVADAMAKWGPERRTKNDSEWVDDVSGEEVAAIPEWGDQLLNRAEAEKIVPGRTLRRWVKDGSIAPVGTIFVAGVKTVLFRRSALERVKSTMQTRAGRPRAGSDSAARASDGPVN